MESGGHKSGYGAVHGAGAEGGLLCHACGYQYPNAHPSAKQRRAHRKHCGKPASAAAEEGGAGEPEGRVLFPGEVAGAVGGGGDGIGATEAECGGGSTGSAQEAASGAAAVDKTEHAPHDAAGAQVIVDKFVEGHSDVASGTETDKTDDGGTLNEVATEYSVKASLPEDGVPSVSASAYSCEQLQDVSVAVLPPETRYGEDVSPELSVSEMQDSNVVSVASDASGGEISEQTIDGTTVTGVDGMANTVGKDIPIEEKSVNGDYFDSSCLEYLQTKSGEEYSPDKNLSAVQIEEIPNDISESNQQTRPMLTSSTDVVPNNEHEEPVKSGTQIGTDDFHSEATDTVQPQEQPDSASVVEDHLAVAEQIDTFEGEHYPNKDGGIEMISSAIGPSVNAEVISVGAADNMTKNVCSSDVTVGDTIQENMNSNTVVSSQADLVDHSTNSTTHEINMVNSTNDVEEKDQNEKSLADLTIHDMNEVHVTELVEENQQDKEIVADSISHGTNAFHTIDNYGENEKETIVEAISCKIPSTSSIEEEKQIEEVIPNPSPERTDVTNNRDSFEENKQIELAAKTNRETSVVCATEATEEKGTTSEINAENITDNVEDKKQSEEISVSDISETTSEINAENITDNVEDKKQSEEISVSDISDGISMICTTVNEEKMHNEGMTEDPSSRGNIVTDNVEEKKYQETMVGPTSHIVSMVTTVDSVEERKNEETSADLASHGINAALSTDNVEKKKDGEPILEPIASKIGTVGSIGDVDKKQQNEENTADQITDENNMPQSTYDAEKSMQNKDAATVVSDKSEVKKKTDAVEGAEHNKETVAKEISTVSMDDLKSAGQNEEIADKEVIVDSDRSHVSLKVLLADKNVETKEKKPSTKDRVLSFRRRSSKDSESPVKPGSPKAGSGQQDWNSPARLPAEKKSKGRKQQWVPFICCPSIH